MTSVVFDQLRTFRHGAICTLIEAVINRCVFWGGIGEGFVTKLVHRAYSGVRPPAINTPGSTRIANCGLLCGALVAIV